MVFSVRNADAVTLCSVYHMCVCPRKPQSLSLAAPHASPHVHVGNASLHSLKRTLPSLAAPPLVALHSLVGRIAASTARFEVLSQLTSAGLLPSASSAEGAAAAAAFAASRARTARPICSTSSS